VRAYLTLARTAGATLYAYRANFALVLLGGVVQAVALFAVWRALLGGADPAAVAGFTWAQMKGYLLVSFAANALLSGYTDLLLAGRVLSGMVALDLTRPLDFQLARFAEALGYLWVELVAVVTVGTGLLLAFGGIPLPTGPQAALFVVSLAAVVPLKFGIVYLTGVACFWTQNYQGLSWARIAVSTILSGSLVPIALYPQWLQTVAQISPFPGIVSSPALIFLGRVRGPEAATLVGWQVAWTVALWVGGRLAWRHGVRQITVHGG
jgi:ABC-2 type transport system permease protein